MSEIHSTTSREISENTSTNQLVTSVRKECIHSLRFPGTQSGETVKPKTHLLACISELIPEEPDFKVEEIEDFCSFDRMKRILEKRKVRSCDKNQEETNDNEKLLKFVQIEAKMKKMENNLMKYTKKAKQDNINEINKKKIIKNNTSLANIFLSSSADKQWKDPALTEQDRRAKILREHGYRHYTEWQKKKLTDGENGIKEFVETEISEKIKTMLEERDNKYNELLKKCKNLEKSILEKNLEIENLKNKQEIVINNMKELEKFKNLFSEENMTKTKEMEFKASKFYEDFHEHFPNETIESLKRYINSLSDKCLEKFNDIECRNFNKWNEEKGEMNAEINRLNGLIEKLKLNENELLNSLKEFRCGQKVATLEMDSLLSSKSELDKLQKKILSLYNDWYGNLSDSEKELMKNLGYLESSYEYEQMLEYIVAYKIKFSTDQKVNDYLIKILRGIQRIRKILFPKTITNTGERIKMDPLFILEKLEKYVKGKVYQIQKKGSTLNKGSRTSQIVEEEFLHMTQESEEDEKEINIFQPINSAKSNNIKKTNSTEPFNSKVSKEIFQKGQNYRNSPIWSKKNKENVIVL